MPDKSTPSWRSPLALFLGAIAFYTCIPLPPQWSLEFYGIAQLAPVVGILIGGVLGLIGVGLSWLGVAALVKSALLVVIWLGLTGGLHLDGAIDTADGLAVLDPERRLEVMADSRTGAFGVMAAISIMLLKTVALADIATYPWLALMLAAGWGRWGQLVAIARYPYLKPTGKGAFHKQAIHSVWQAVPSLLLLMGLSGVWGYLQQSIALGFAALVLGSAIAILAGAYFNYRLNGQTGDTYGAIVEWSEALVLCGLTSLS